MESPRPAGVTDVHIHIQPWEHLRPGVDRMLRESRAGDDLHLIERCQADPGALLAEMDRCGVARAGLINYTSRLMGFGDDVNDWVVAYVRGRADRLIAFGCPDPARTGDVSGRIEALAGAGLRGIKIHPPHMEFSPNAYTAEPEHPLAKIYETAQRLGLPVMFHTGTSAFPGARSRLGDPMLVDDVAVDFPEMKIILAHAGRPLWPEASFFLARRHPNVWLDLSGIPARRIPQLLPRLDVIGTKVLYGSDWPGPGVPSMEACLEGFWSLALPEKLKTALFVENSRAVFR